jgi:nitroimidazol reductase NimA-like FMN-containing flavoprotein (pyridoxamine 5'-phosphate oxidase superfamily)
MAETPAFPRFRPLTREECAEILARNCVGRVAFLRGTRVEIVPIHYVFASGVVRGRTARGTRLDETRDSFYRAWPVAFEVDEVDALFQWRSVVVHGNLHGAAIGDAEWHRNQGDWEAAMHSFRRLVPAAFKDDDPTSFRDIVLRIEPTEITGREALDGSRGR